MAFTLRRARVPSRLHHFGNSTAKLQDLDHFAYVRLKKFFCNKHSARAKRVVGRFRTWWPQSGVMRFYVPGACGRVL